jgi:hypothetical protein
MDNHDEFTDEEATWDRLFPISTPSPVTPTFSMPRGSFFGLGVGEFDLNSMIPIDNMSFMDILGAAEVSPDLAVGGGERGGLCWCIIGTR